MAMREDYRDIRFENNGKLKLLIVVGTRPEVIRLSATIHKCRAYFDTILAHTGQNYDYSLNEIFFRDLKLKRPDVYMDTAGGDLGAAIGNIIHASYKLMRQVKPDALLILGDTNSCLCAIAAKRLPIPIFHMEAGNRCKDERLPEETNRRIVDIISDVNMAYSEHARRYLEECGLPVDPDLIGMGYYVAESTRKYLPKLIERGATAILCSDDSRAVAAYTECYDRRLNIPKDVSIVGFDDQPLAAYMTPPLTTVRQDRLALGKCGYYALSCLLNSVEIDSIHLRAPLIVRGSTGPAPGQDQVLTPQSKEEPLDANGM